MRTERERIGGAAAVLVLWTVATVLVPACAVKEDRSGCPCTLVLDMRSVRSDVLVDVTRAAALHLADSVAAEVEEYALSVPRYGVVLNVVEGDRGLFRPGGGVRIPEGYDCPPLYMHAAWVSTGSDEVHEKVELRKSFCGITFLARGATYAMEVEGRVAGYGSDGKAEEGAFSYRCRPDAAGEAYVRVPRQRDASLLLHLQEGTFTRTFALGEFIAASGYDWTAPDLADITVELDFAATTVTFRIDAWERTVRLEVLI